MFASIRARECVRACMRRVLVCPFVFTCLRSCVCEGACVQFIGSKSECMPN